LFGLIDYFRKWRNKKKEEEQKQIDTWNSIAKEIKNALSEDKKENNMELLYLAKITRFMKKGNDFMNGDLVGIYQDDDKLYIKLIATSPEDKKEVEIIR